MVLGGIEDWCLRFSNGCYIGLLPYSPCLLKKGTRETYWLVGYEQGTHARNHDHGKSLANAAGASSNQGGQLKY